MLYNTFLSDDDESDRAQMHAGRGQNHQLRTVAGGLDIQFSTSPVSVPEVTLTAASWFRWLSCVLRMIAFAAVLREPLFALLVYFASVASIEQIITLFFTHQLISKAADIGIHIAVAPFAVVNLINDWISVSPSDDVDKFLHSHSAKNKYKRWLKNALLSVAIPFSFTAGACSDILPLSNAINGISDPTSRVVTKYTTLGIIIFLGDVYYYMLTNQNIQNHVKAFINILRNPHDFLNHIRVNTLAYTEASIVILGNSVYRAILFGSVVKLMISTYFEADNQTNLSNILTYTVMGVTALITLFSRALPVLKFFIPLSQTERNTIQPYMAEAWVKVKPRSLAPWLIIKSMIFPLIRSLGLSFMLYEALNQTWLPLQCTVSLGTGLSLFALSFFTHYRSHVDSLVIHEAKMLRASFEFTVQQAQAQTPLLENTNLPLTNTRIGFSSYHEWLAEFQTLQSQKKLSTWLSTAIDIINIMTRIIRLVGFPVFVMTLASSFGLELGAWMLLGAVLFWGGEVVQCELKFYGAMMQAFVAGLLVKLALVTDHKQQSVSASDNESISEATPIIPRLAVEAESTGWAAWAGQKLSNFAGSLWHSGPSLIAMREQQRLSYDVMPERLYPGSFRRSA